MKHGDLVSRMTLEEKCALLAGKDVWHTREIPRLNIPAITLSDGPSGLRKQAGEGDHLGLNASTKATCIPSAATLACSWDDTVSEAMGAVVGRDAANQGVDVLLAPGLHTKRSSLCGGSFEYYSEDPYLSGKLAAAYVRGIQSNGIAACPKHFAVNSQELRRMASDSVVDERTLRELYLTGFEIVVKEAHPKTIMSSYNLVNGTYANENAHLLQDILRRDWGFDGAVVTDWGGSNDHALGVKNGSTLEMPAPGGDAVRELLKAVETGKISESDVDARLDELLTLVLDTHAAVENHSRSFDAAAPHALARRAAFLRRAIELREEESGNQYKSMLKRALHYIDQNYTDENLSLNAVAKAANISPNYFSGVFSQEMGQTFVEYLTEKRMARAKELLRYSGKRSSEVAYEVGYRDPRYFSFLFKKTQGCTPSSYRAGNGDGHEAK